MRALGADAERRVRRHYRLRGYAVLDANVLAGGNELDLVLRRGRRLIFCEVKARSSDAFGTALEAIDDEKQRRLHRAAETWLAARPSLVELDVSFEAAVVTGRRIERVPFG